jgi:uncharacterized protein YqcC (DUF446 family)/Tfp pilus assembly protein PilF
MAPDSKTIREHLDAVVTAMKESGAWNIEPPKDGALVDMGPFGMKTMAFEQWLRYVFVPSVEERLASNGPWPTSSSVAAQATREGDTNPVVASLVDALHAFDALFEPPAPPPALRELTPPPRAQEPYERARAALARNDHRAALAAISEALLLDRAYPNAHNLAGWILFLWPARTAAQLDDAIGHFREALKIAPEDGVPLANLCDALVAAKREDEAIAEAERESASAAWGRAAYAFNWLGWRALTKPDGAEAAVELFRRAVAKRSTWGVARTNLAKALEVAHHPDEAYEEHARALACADAHDRAFCYERRSAYEARHAWYRNALTSMRLAFVEDDKLGGGRKQTYGEALTWREGQLRGQSIEFPNPGGENAVAWVLACHDEIPAGFGASNEWGESLADDVVEIERLLRAHRWDDAIHALQALDWNKRIDAIGYTSLGVRRALAEGNRDMAITLQRLVLDAYVAHASNASSGGEGMARMLDVKRERDKLRELERAK